jgi:cell division protein ZapE
MKQSVRQRYESLAAAGEVSPDASQRALAARLDRLLDALAEKRLSSKKSALGWIFARGARPEPVRGLYIWGPVGRGKTMLMDLFFAAAPHVRKRRAHFHNFMADVHERLHAARAAQRNGVARSADPVGQVSAAVAREARLLCFDEFTVTDIADAMILARLFRHLFDDGVTLVATSNLPPEAQYEGGLNRELFLPFIALLRERTEIFHLDAPSDYRQGLEGSEPLYVVPPGTEADACLAAHFERLTGARHGAPASLTNKGRRIAVPEAADGVARFTFEELCGRPLSAGDYLKIASRFDTLIVSGIPVMGPVRREEAKRFINLIDTLYDRGVRLVASAEAEPEGLWIGRDGFETAEFARTASRLGEMRSDAWWNAARAGARGETRQG